MYKKHLREKVTSSLIFVFVLFVLLLGCAFVLLVLSVLFVLLVRAKSFRKKKNKEFKTVLMTSFTLLLVKFWSGDQKLVFGNLDPKVSWSHKSRTSFNFHKETHFVQSHKLNPTKLSNLRKHLNVGLWGLKTSFGSFGVKILFKSHILRTLTPIFTKITLFFIQIYTSEIQQNHQIFKTSLTLRSGA